MATNRRVNIIWEQADGYLTEIAKVHGGWLVKTAEPVFQLDPQGSNPQPTQGYTSSMVYVPDPNHEWEMEDLIGLHN